MSNNPSEIINIWILKLLVIGIDLIKIAADTYY